MFHLPPENPRTKSKGGLEYPPGLFDRRLDSFYHEPMVNAVSGTAGAAGVSLVSGAASAGTVTNVESEAGHIGIVRCRASATPDSARLAVGNMAGATGAGNLFKPGAGVLRVITVIRFSHAGSGSERWTTQLGPRDVIPGGTSDDQCVLHYRDDINNGNWRIGIEASTVTPTDINLGVAPIFGSFFELAWEYSSDGRAVKFFQNGDQIGETFGTLSTKSQLMSYILSKNVGTNARDLDVDDLLLWHRRAVPLY